MDTPAPQRQRGSSNSASISQSGNTLSMPAPPSAQSSPFNVSPVAGQKRAAPSLLPAFEPALPTPKVLRTGRANDASFAHVRASRTAANPQQLPSAPTSSTAVPTSSPPALPNSTRVGGGGGRSDLHRAVAALTERAPLAAVPSIELDEAGEPTLMGRSSNSSHYQLSTNKLVSRVHVRAMYIPATAEAPKRVQIECTGWNGVKVHCQGKAWELFRGDTFTSETEDADIMIDVQDARVLITWPKPAPKALTPSDSEGTWDSENSPTRSPSRLAAAAARTGRAAPSGTLNTSPLRREHRLHSPISPSPATQTAAVGAMPVSAAAATPPAVQIYEDEPAEDAEQSAPRQSFTQPTQSTQILTQPLQDSGYADAECYSDNDEENDPVVHALGPFGANISNRLESFTTNASPDVRNPLQPLKDESISPQRRLTPNTLPPETYRRRQEQITRLSPKSAPDLNANILKKPASDEPHPDHETVVNFSINHLLYSQLSATPLSSLLQHVQAHLKSESPSTQAEAFTSDALQTLLDNIPCIGVVHREGKDAAGKRLESEYYYIPEQDDDSSRREVVQDLGIGGRGLRNCRKSHKQYFWRKPK